MNSRVLNTSPAPRYKTALLARRWLSEKILEIELSRPATFRFSPGQRLRFIHRDLERDYSIASAPAEPTIALCIRNVEGGRFSPFLSDAKMGTQFSFSGPHGYFTFHSSRRKAVFLATGTGIAPFASMGRSGIRDFILLHGVRLPTDLYYEALFRDTARLYIPCLSGISRGAAAHPDTFYGRVTEYLEKQLSLDSYDFYLCGRQEMIRDVTAVVDERFPKSLIYTEVFF
jgi:benzoate/toluate 1,2-dioxygenase reductase subunit